jgi:hypothetical protein
MNDQMDEWMEEYFPKHKDSYEPREQEFKTKAFVPETFNPLHIEEPEEPTPYGLEDGDATRESVKYPKEME